MAWQSPSAGKGSEGPGAGRSARIPLGWPGVPDEYSMAAPSDSSGPGVAGDPATSASQGSQPAGRGPGPVVSIPSRPGPLAAAALATPLLAPQLHSPFSRAVATTYGAASRPRK